MTCETLQNLLLALPDPARPTDDLRGHLAGCPACRAVQAEAVRIERLLARLPVPSSEARKLAFLDSLAAAGPVIKSKPVLPSSQTGSGAFRPVGQWLRKVDLRWVGGVAAAVLVGVGGVWWANRPGPAVADAPERPRHPLLARTVKHTTDLARVSTPKDRLAVFADWSADLKAEACGMYAVAQADEMNSLARQYERAVSEGVRKQAELINGMTVPLTGPERQQAFADALGKLDEAATDAGNLAEKAPQASKAALKRIADTAKKERNLLAQLARG